MRLALVCAGVTLEVKRSPLNFSRFLPLFFHPLGCFGRLRKPSDIASNAAESSSQGGSALPPPAQEGLQRNQSSTIAFAQQIKGTAPLAVLTAPKARQDLSPHP